MRRALALAAKGRCTVHPNPAVGCVIVRDGAIVGEGYHRYCGQEHAEVLALRQAGNSAVGSTVFVTLAPCAHHGRTPPCVEVLLQACVNRVVIAAVDPNPLVEGGVETLREAGIRVQTGLFADASEALNPGFFKRHRQKMPWVRLKVAMSLDAKMALANGHSQWITESAAREDGQEFRAKSSAILTGIHTVMQDHPRLTVRHPIRLSGPPLIRVILDSTLQLQPTAKLFDSDGPIWIYTESTDAAKKRSLQQKGAELFSMSPKNLTRVLNHLAEKEINELMVEAGPRITSSFLSEDLVDELIVYIAPKWLGPDALSAFNLPNLTALHENNRPFILKEAKVIENDVRLVYYRK